MAGTVWVESGASLNPCLPLSKSEMKPLLVKLFTFLGLSHASVEVRFVDDAGIARLNREFLGLSGPTNVLSFPATDPSRLDYLGEIALSVDTLTREAALYGQDPREHLVRLLTHGILHLAGYEHGQAMEEMTNAAVSALS